jgi:hypothetical protein
MLGGEAWSGQRATSGRDFHMHGENALAIHHLIDLVVLKLILILIRVHLFSVEDILVSALALVLNLGELLRS